MQRYLSEHVDEILDAIRHSMDLLCENGKPWETTAWARSQADANELAEALRTGVFAELDLIEGPVEACVGVVRSGAGRRLRWGVLVRLARR
jgi:hypothetical protein